MVAIAGIAATGLGASCAAIGGLGDFREVDCIGVCEAEPFRSTAAPAIPIPAQTRRWRRTAASRTTRERRCAEVGWGPLACGSATCTLAMECCAYHEKSGTPAFVFECAATCSVAAGVDRVTALKCDRPADCPGQTCCFTATSAAAATVTCKSTCSGGTDFVMCDAAGANTCGGGELHAFDGRARVVRVLQVTRAVSILARSPFPPRIPVLFRP